MSNIRTVSDTKRAFYTAHIRPVNSIYRRVVEELMVEMHLLSVNAEFQYDPIYALGVVTTFDRFMKGYRPEEDTSSIFSALCQSVEGAEANQYRQDAESLLAEASQLSSDDLGVMLNQVDGTGGSGVQVSLGAIAQASSFKYSRLFAIGLLTVVEAVDDAIVTDEAELGKWVQRFCELLNLPKEKVDKDLEIYRSNLEKLRQAQEVIEDVLKADRKKREERQAAATEQDSEQGNEQDSTAAEPAAAPEHPETESSDE